MSEAPIGNKRAGEPVQVRKELTRLVVSGNDVRTMGNEAVRSLDRDGAGVPMLAVIAKLLTTADRYNGGEDCLEEVKKWFAGLWGLLGIMQTNKMLDEADLPANVDKIRRQLERRGIVIVLDI